MATATKYGNVMVSTPTERSIAVSREFNAPKHLVYEALTKPELLKRWLHGAPGWTLAECELDLRVGGKYRYVWRKGDKQMVAAGVITEVNTPNSFMAREHFEEPWYSDEAIVTNTLEERDGKTTLTLLVEYASVKDRDASLNAPMAKGLDASYNILEELLGTMGR